MKTQRLMLALTAVNLVILVVALVFVLRPAVSPDVVPVLRGHGLEITDSEGRLRAQIVIEPAGTQNGQAYSETVLLRLMNQDGMPALKIATSVDDSGILLSRHAANQQQFSGVQILSQEAGGLVRIVSQGGQEEVVRP